MSFNSTSHATKTRTLSTVAVYALLWTFLLAASLAWNLYSITQNTVESARLEARSTYGEVVDYLRWNSKHGGVYVEEPIETQLNKPKINPNKENVVITTSKKKLKLINPATMMRQVNELSKDKAGTQTRLSSLNPLNEKNSPDEWEEGALLRLTSGMKEYSTLATIDGIEYMRFMKPLLVETQCLSCHINQGQKVGDISGGISVIVPMAPLTTAKRQIYILSCTCTLYHLARRSLRSSLINRTPEEERGKKACSRAQVKETYRQAGGDGQGKNHRA